MNGKPLSGAGWFQWNAGGWYGSQLGSTVWMLVGAVVLAPHALWVALSWLGCFASANFIGTWLWRRRGRLQPYPAMQMLIVVCATTGLMALLVLDLAVPGNVRLNVIANHYLGYAFLLMAVPLGLGYFAVLERSARKARSKSDD